MRDFFFILGVVALCTGVLLNTVHRRNGYYETGYALGRARQTMASLQEEHKRLLVDRASLLDPGRLSPIARRNGYAVAAADQVVLLDLDVEPTTVAR